MGGLAQDKTNLNFASLVWVPCRECGFRVQRRSRSRKGSAGLRGNSTNALADQPGFRGVRRIGIGWKAQRWRLS
jgi:hypothetical protein